MDYAMWTEKYRPATFTELRGHSDIVQRISAFVEQKNMPHLLFSGPAGVGKTSLSLVIARALYGDDWKQNFLELNASDERGIDVVREKVKEFARQPAVDTAGLFRIVYLDEADALTKDAQHALRRTMENYSHICRFILAVNYSGKIIPPIQSRTAVFRFSSLKEDDVISYLKIIAKAEKLKIDHWCDKEATRDAVHNIIRDFLWSDETGLLAGSYSEDEVEVRAGEVFQHVYRVYPRLPSPIYGAMTSCQ